MALSVVPGSDKKQSVSLRADFIDSKMKTLQDSTLCCQLLGAEGD